MTHAREAPRASATERARGAGGGTALGEWSRPAIPSLFVVSPGRVARHVADRFGLRPGLGAGEAADVLWTLTAPELVERLVHRRGRSLDRYEAWTARTTADALLGPPADRGAG